MWIDTPGPTAAGNTTAAHRSAGKWNRRTLSHTHSLTHLRALSLIHSLTHSLTHSFILIPYSTPPLFTAPQRQQQQQQQQRQQQQQQQQQQPTWQTAGFTIEVSQHYHLLLLSNYYQIFVINSTSRYCHRVTHQPTFFTHQRTLFLSSPLFCYINYYFINYYCINYYFINYYYIHFY
jgi:hypothetical protein